MKTLPKPMRLTPVPAPAELGYVEFWRAGAQAVGQFSCADCGRSIRSVRQLPDCPGCGGAIWEQTATSPLGPLAGLEALLEDPAAGAWYREDLREVARVGRGVWVAVLLAPLFWLVPAGLGVALFMLVR
jgi:hypothetical protein